MLKVVLKPSLAVVGLLFFAQLNVFAATVPVEQRAVGDQIYRRSTQDAVGYADQQYANNPNTAETADPLWELVSQLQVLQTEVLELRGVVDQQNYEIQQLQKQQKQHYVDLDQRIEMLSGGAKPETLSERSIPSSATNLSSQPEDPQAMKAIYDKALEAVRIRNYAEAENQFRQILAGSESFFTPFAHYWLAEVLLAKKKPDINAARTSFEIVVDRYDGHSKVAPSLYKLGTILHVQGDSAKARETLKRLIGAYPGSAEANMASNYLDQM